MRFSPMLRTGALAAAALLLLAPAAHAQQGGSPAPAPAAAAERPQPRPEDVASEDAILKALYDVISGPPGDSVRDWNRFRSLFTPGASVVFAVTREDGSTIFREGDVEGYIAVNGPIMAREGFWEREIHRTMDRFGSIAQVFSTYEYHQGPGTETVRGINSIQLARHGGRWWVVSLLVDPESPWNPIPAEYLPR